jgi:hypothetical protein
MLLVAESGYVTQPASRQEPALHATAKQEIGYYHHFNIFYAETLQNTREPAPGRPMRDPGRLVHSVRINNQANFDKEMYN